MSDNLKDAAESGFRIYGEKIQAPFSNEDLTDLLEAYTYRILASQQAAHEAEIARLNLLVAALQEDKEIAEEQTATANAACAMKDEALKTAASDLRGYDNYAAAEFAEQAISASSQQVSEWERKQLEPLRGEVATLRYALVWVFEVFKINPEQWPDTYEVVNDAINNTQATAQAYEQEVEARGAVKALGAYKEKYRCVFHKSGPYLGQAIADLVDKEIAELRATSKKAG